VAVRAVTASSWGIRGLEEAGELVRCTLGFRSCLLGCRISGACSRRRYETPADLGEGQPEALCACASRVEQELLCVRQAHVEVTTSDKGTLILQ